MTTKLDIFSAIYHIDGLMQERRNSTANALELCLSYTNPSFKTSNFLEGK